MKDATDYSLTRLKRNISFSDVLAYGLLYFVPLAPVSIFGIIYNISAGVVALVYLVAAVAMLFSAISYSQMAKYIPSAGSVYSYVSQGVNPFLGFVAGWAILLDYLLLPALLAILGAIALEALFPHIPKAVWLLSFVLVPMGINLFGIRTNAMIGKILLLIQLLVLAIFFSFSLKHLLTIELSAQFLLAPFYHPQFFSMTALFAAVPIATLSFIGFDAVSTLNEEAKGGGETVSKVTLLLLVIVTLLFTLQVYVAALLVPIGTVYTEEEAEKAFYLLSRDVVEAWFLPVITLTSGIVAILANALVSQATTAKVLFTMARDGRLPRQLSHLNKYHAPQSTIVMVAFLSFIIAWFGQDQVALIVTLVTFGALTAYILLHCAVLRFFNRQRAERHLFLHIVSPLLGGGFYFTPSSTQRFKQKLWVVYG